MRGVLLRPMILQWPAVSVSLLRAWALNRSVFCLGQRHIVLHAGFDLLCGGVGNGERKILPIVHCIANIVQIRFFVRQMAPHSMRLPLNYISHLCNVSVFREEVKMSKLSIVLLSVSVLYVCVIINAVQCRVVYPMTAYMHKRVPEVCSMLHCSSNFFLPWLLASYVPYAGSLLSCHLLSLCVFGLCCSFKWQYGVNLVEKYRRIFRRWMLFS